MELYLISFFFLLFADHAMRVYEFISFNELIIVRDLFGMIFVLEITSFDWIL